MRTGTNLPRVGDFNQTVVLDRIRRSPGGLSRAQLTRETGLSAQAVSNIAARLLAAGLVTESGAVAHHGRGRPATRLCLIPSARYAIGVHIDPLLVSFALVGLDGRPVAQGALRTPETGRPEALIGQLLATIDRLVGETGIERERVLGVGLAVPGPIDADAGVVLDPPLLPAWHDVPLRGAIESGTGMLALMDKDVNAAASAVVWGSPSAVGRDFAYVYIGAGVAIAVVLGGQVRRGPSANAGEAGEWLVDVDGQPRTLGQCVGARALVAQAIEAGVLSGDGTDLGSFRDVTEALATLCAKAEHGDGGADRLLAAAATRIAYVAGALARQLDLQSVVVGGPTWEMWPRRYLATVDEALGTWAGPHALWRFHAEHAPYGTLAGAVGGASLVLEQVFAPRAETLMLANNDDLCGNAKKTFPLISRK